ncbi:MAG: hypothetical protein AVO33_03565 [delta proteobacterium ML8_F1]|nr:MAG: hypothetical protein AVO33_03565 [delta proteobacterium ML8_F1]
MTLLERFANPDLIVQMEFSEKLLASTYVALLGIGITFLALILLWGVIEIQSRLVAGIDKKAEGVKVAPQAKAPVATGQKEAAAEPAEDFELVAVIAAALAAATGQPVNQIVVKNIRRIAGEQPAWKSAGINAQFFKRM